MLLISAYVKSVGGLFLDMLATSCRFIKISLNICFGIYSKFL